MVLIKCTKDKEKRECHFIASIKMEKGEREIP